MSDYCEYCNERTVGRNDMVWARWEHRQGFVHKHCVQSWKKKVLLDDITDPYPCALCGCTGGYHE